MDPAAVRPGYSIAIAPPPFSPWMRLAHRWDVACDQVHPLAWRRRLRDFEFFLQVAGSSWIGLPGGGHVPLPSGWCALIPPGLVHAWGHIPGGHIAVHADLHAQPRLLPMAMVERIDEPCAPGASRPDWRWQLILGGERMLLPLAIAVDPAEWQARFAPLLRMYRDRSLASPAARLAAAAMVGEAFARWLALAGGGGEDPLLALCATAAEDGVGVPELARRAGMGQTALRAAVRQRTGRSPRAHLERLRIERAAWLLRSGSIGVAEVAERCGFADPFHFSRVFRRVMGASPAIWRNR